MNRYDKAKPEQLQMEAPEHGNKLPMVRGDSSLQ
jgi:hypothetical protein